MASESFEEIIESLKASGKMSFIEKATEEHISEFEKKNSIKLPSGFTEWLLFSDGGDLFLPAGVQMYGVSHKPIINVNDDDRPDEKYVVIGALASGDPILFEKNTEKICIFNHEDGVIEEEELYPDFKAFLKDLIDSFGDEA